MIKGFKNMRNLQNFTLILSHSKMTYEEDTFFKYFKKILLNFKYLNTCHLDFSNSNMLIIEDSLKCLSEGLKNLTVLTDLTLNL